MVKRSEFCSRCKELKIPRTDSDTYCKPCRATIKRERLARNRAAAGLRPIGSGRNPNCTICGAITDSDHSFCQECRRPRARAAYEAKFADPVEVEKRKLERRKKVQEDFDHRKKLAAQRAAYDAISDGTLVREPCEVCGEKRVDAHHDNYDKPLDVRWLCRKHHRLHHERNNSLDLEDYLI